MSTRASDLLTLTREGLYCPLGDFHVDPTWPVKRALITHGHADHARAGHIQVMATPETLRIMAVRYGEDFCTTSQEAALGEAIRIGDVTVRFVPAGHVLGSAQIVIEREGIPLGETRKVVAAERKDLAGAIVICPPSSIQDLWSRKFPDPVTCFASGWMRVRARARQKGVELPLVISDHADWPDLCRTIRETGAGEVWVTHGQEDALVHWCGTEGIRAKPLHLLGYGDDGEAEPAPAEEAA